MCQKCAPRQSEVLVLIGEGQTTIAQRLDISFKAVASHRSHIMEKLNVHHTATLVRYAIRNKLMEP